MSRANPADTGRKSNVHKTFRRRPGRLLNVLCTFNVRLIIDNWNKSVLESTKLTSANNRGESISYQKISSFDFYKLQVTLLTTLINGLEVFSSASDKAKLLYLRTMNYTSQVAHVDFSPETYLKWRNIMARYLKLKIFKFLS